LDTEYKIVYKYDTLEEFENQCRQLGIDNIEFQAVDSFSVRSYARFANNGL
jgi:phosphosulfolactate synthase (CoM biosynthesis protein A)